MGNEDKTNSAIIPFSTNSLRRAEKTIRITEKLLQESSNNNMKWWESLTPEWRRAIYMNYELQDKIKTFRRLYFLQKMFNRRYDVFSDPTEMISRRKLNNILQIEKCNLQGTKYNNYKILNRFDNLKKLNLSSSTFSDISEIDKTLRRIESLGLDSTSISSLSGLEKAKQLQFLSLENTDIDDLYPLRNLKKLQLLRIGGAGVTDLSPLSNLQNLQMLLFSSSSVRDLSPLSNLHNLQELHFIRTKPSDLSSLNKIRSLQKLTFNTINRISISPLSNLQNLQEFCFERIRINDLSVLSNFKSFGVAIFW